MFPSQSFVSTPIFEQHITLEDLNFLDSSNNVVPENTKKRQRKSSNNFEEHKNENNEGKMKKIMHRDIERKRRQEMSHLYTSLRSLLPLGCIKGKRSISDHMHEAVNHINHMEKKIKELKIKRDELKKSFNSSYYHQNTKPNPNLNIQNIVTVNPCLDGLEILISIGFGAEEKFLISIVIKLLNETGLNVISYVFSTANGKFFYKIQSQDNGLAHFNLPMLQQRLTFLINSC